MSHFPYVNSGENSTISQGRSDTTRHLEFLEQYVANSKRSLSVCCHQYEYSELKNSHACWRSPKMVALHGRQFGVRLLSQESCLWNLTAKTKGPQGKVLFACFVHFCAEQNFVLKSGGRASFKE